MPDFDTLVKKYTHREKSALVDSIALGLSWADEVSVGLGLMEDAGLLADVLDHISTALPFVVVIVQEGGKVLFKKKTREAGVQDAGYRLMKSGAAMGAGAAVAAAGMAGAALPVAVTVRLLIDRVRSRKFTGLRVAQRIQRVQSLRSRRERQLRLMPSYLSALGA